MSATVRALEHDGITSEHDDPTLGCDGLASDLTLTGQVKGHAIVPKGGNVALKGGNVPLKKGCKSYRILLYPRSTIHLQYQGQISVVHLPFMGEDVPHPVRGDLFCLRPNTAT